jgi:hypothetical protein
MFPLWEVGILWSNFSNFVSATSFSKTKFHDDG